MFKTSKPGAAAVILLAFLLFYLPSMLALFSSDGEPRSMTMLNVAMATCYTLIFILNYFIIIPKTLFGKDRTAIFFATNLIIVAGLCSLLPIWLETHGGLPKPGHAHKALTESQRFMVYARFAIRDGVMMVLSVSLAYALRLSKAREEMRLRVLELESERQNTELMSLKAQLNPHFLFNSLNNIYALIAIDPDKAQQSLHELSGMLRFMIYDSQSSTVELSREITFLSNYTRLMSLRLNPSVKLTCSLPEITDSTLRIAPLLMLTLVENAFKHVAVNDNKGFIDIHIGICNDTFLCRISNSSANRPMENLESGNSGVGLKNIEKQLNLLYPDQYKLKVDETSGKYEAELTIKTSALTNKIQSARFHDVT